MFFIYESNLNRIMNIEQGILNADLKIGKATACEVVTRQ